MRRSSVRRGGRLPAAVGGLAATMAFGGLSLGIHSPAVAAPVARGGVVAAGVDGAAAGNAAIASVDLSGTWSFTPTGRGATSIVVPGGGWYKQGFTDVVTHWPRRDSWYAGDEAVLDAVATDVLPKLAQP